MCNRYYMTAAQIDLARPYDVTLIYPERETCQLSELHPDRVAWAMRDERGTRELARKTWRSRHAMPGKKMKATGLPMLLHEEDEERWLRCSLDEAVALVAPFP